VSASSKPIVICQRDRAAFLNRVVDDVLLAFRIELRVCNLPPCPDLVHHSWLAELSEKLPQSRIEPYGIVHKDRVANSCNCEELGAGNTGSHLLLLFEEW
jgi:hypothetical protein